MEGRPEYGTWDPQDGRREHSPPHGHCKAHTLTVNIHTHINSKEKHLKELENAVTAMILTLLLNDSLAV